MKKRIHRKIFNHYLTYIAVSAVIIFFALILCLYRDSARLAEQTGYLYQINSRFMDREIRLELVKSDLLKRILSNEVIYPEKANHPVFAGEEVAHTVAWYDILVHSADYNNFDDSSKAIVDDMAADITILERSFVKLQRLSKDDQKKRSQIMIKELSPAASRLVQCCQDFVMANALSFQMKNRVSIMLHRNAAALMSIITLFWLAFAIIAFFSHFKFHRRS